jgi:hypothetical protein
MKKKRLFRQRIHFALLAGLLALFVFNSNSYASLAIDFTGTTVDWNDGENYSLGWSFTADTNLVIDSLGVYAAPDFTSGERLFTQAHAVGLFNSNGDLITSTSVTSADPLIGFFRWHPLDSAVTLSAGSSYYIAAAMGADQYTWDPTGFTVNSNITFGQNYYVVSDTLVLPTGTDGSSTIGYFGPNMNVVPIPGAVWLLGSVLAGTAVLRRKRLG